MRESDAIKLGNATFTALRGCRIELNGWLACIDTKLAMLFDGVCNINAVEIENAAKAAALMDTPCGDAGSHLGCGDARLVELAAHYWEWCNDEANAPWADTLVHPLSESQAIAKFGVRLARLSSLDNISKLNLDRSAIAAENSANKPSQGPVRPLHEEEAARGMNPLE